MLEYDVLCYRVMWRGEKDIEWKKSDFSQEKIAYKFYKEVIEIRGFECKLLKVLEACIWFWGV